MIKKQLTNKFALLLGASVCIFANKAHANYYGRYTSGGFFSKEVFRNDTTSNRYNDVSVLSQRFFMSVDKFNN